MTAPATAHPHGTGSPRAGATRGAPVRPRAHACGSAGERPHTSTYSNAEGGNCVEVAHRTGGGVPVRDTKCPEGPALFFGTGAWAAFVDALKGRSPHA